MRELNIGTKKYSKVVCFDEPGAGGACHEYQICSAKGNPLEDASYEYFGEVRFQKGPIKEAGVNGCHQEDLLAIIIDRLQHFQKGDFACKENALALTKCEEALAWLRHRTNERIARGIEGMNIK
jgi:hypothetical protein